MISSSNIIRTGYNQVFLDKENNARNANISSHVDRKSLYSQKGKRFQEGSSKSTNSLLEQNENIRTVNPTINPSANPLLKPLVLRTEEDVNYNRRPNTNRVSKILNFVNYNRRPNTNRVSKILNFEERTDTVSTSDESNYSSVHSNLSIPNKPQDHKINLEKDKLSLLQEKERKKTTIDAPNAAKAIEEDKIKHLASKLAFNEKDDTFSKSYQNKIIERYTPCILKTLKQKDAAWTPKNALKNHKIPSNLRAKMVDWMIEVLTSYKCSDQTFFVALNIMDLYFQKVPANHEVSDLHLVGVTSMFIASKYEEIYPLRLSVVHEKIAHRKLSAEAIKKKEKEIIDAMEYKLTGVTPYDFMMIALFQMNLRDVLNEKMHDYLLKVCIYLSKMAMHDYDLINQQTYSELAASTVFVAFKIIEQLEKSFPLFEKAKQIRELLEVDEEIMFECATRILSMAKNFEKLYPNLENLKKLNSFSLDNSTGIFGHSKQA